MLDDIGLDGFELDEEFMKQFRNSYNEEEIKKFLEHYMVNGIFRASSVIEFECDNDFFLMVVYCIIYAAEHNFDVQIINNIIETKKFKVKDFEIKKR